MENYKLILNPYTNEACEYAMRMSDGVFVHRELNVEYTKWLEEGNTPLPADEPGAPA
jgi:hypothetical protein